MDAKDPISSGELAVFQTYADLVNSERATMWARHNTMLVANSLILSALAISPRPARRRASDQRRLAGDYDRRVVGSTPSRDHRRNIRGILFRPLAEPLCAERLRRSAVRIYRLILGVIAVFGAMYLGLAYAHLAG